MSKGVMSLRVGIYARVSTTDKGQDPDLQLVPLREYVERRGWIVAREYVELRSGRDTSRPEYQALRRDARSREIDVVLVWRFDRFARSTIELLAALEEFRALGVDFISQQEQIDTTTPMGQVVFSLIAAIAQFESSLISQRVREGMANAKRKGKHVGRPALPEHVQEELREAHGRKQAGEPVSIRSLARKLDISHTSVRRYFNALDNARPEA